jgi:hypothetical protein
MNKMFLGEGEKKVHKFLKFSQTISLAPHIQKKAFLLTQGTVIPVPMHIRLVLSGPLSHFTHHLILEKAPNILYLPDIYISQCDTGCD